MRGEMDEGSSTEAVVRGVDQRTDAGPVDLLWTGGWDSTFLLLRLLLWGRRRVTPYYLIDAERPSTGAELRAMKRIRDRLFREHPEARGLLGPTRYFAVADVAVNREVTDAHAAILRRRDLGSQWDWLPRFCAEHALTGMHVGVHRGDKTHTLLTGMVTEDPRAGQPTGCSRVCRVDPRFEGTEEYVLFRHFSFSLVDLTKLDMAALAETEGWRAIMEMTWFCHTPRWGTTPCGKCTPCLGVMRSGLGRRIPPASRALSRFERAVTDPLKSSAREALRRTGLSPGKRRRQSG